MFDIQKASLLKRFSAWLLDFILMTIAVTGFAYLISVVTGYQGYIDTISDKQAYYENEYGVDFDISEEDFNILSKEEQDYIVHVHDELYAKDNEVLYAYDMTINLTLTIATLSLLFSCMLLEFFVPLFLKNGQTVGKKLFAIGVVHANGVRLTNFALFARTLLGKYTIETMIPVIILVTMIFGGSGVVGITVLGLILILELFVFFKDKLFTPIHDVLGHTVCVDLASQMVFENVDELMAYKAKLHADAVEKAEY